MKTFLPYLTLAVACALPLGANAQESGLSKKFDACMKKADGVTLEMIECISAEEQRQDARLNKAYKALMAQQNPERKKALQTTQRAWMKFRDFNCEFYNDPDGGSMARVNAIDCLMNMTANRAKELENLTN